MRPLLLLLVLVALVPTSAGAATHAVSMSDHIFWSTSAMSSTITISPGDTVTWENRGNVTHNARADDGTWASLNLRPGESYSRTFSLPGEYSYTCSLHVVEEMFGTVIVAGAPATGTPTPTPTATATPTAAPTVTSGANRVFVPITPP